VAILSYTTYSQCKPLPISLVFGWVIIRDFSDKCLLHICVFQPIVPSSTVQKNTYKITFILWSFYRELINKKKQINKNKLLLFNIQFLFYTFASNNSMYSSIVILNILKLSFSNQSTVCFRAGFYFTITL